MMGSGRLWPFTCFLKRRTNPTPAASGYKRQENSHLLGEISNQWQPIQARRQETLRVELWNDLKTPGEGEDGFGEKAGSQGRRNSKVFA